MPRCDDTSSELTAILRRLERETFVRSAEWHAELDSTNSYALSLAARGETLLPLLIGASRQTAGRGRGGNSWWSSAGALTFSLLVDPSQHGLPFARWPQVALMTGLAVADTLEQFLPPATIQLKWPNDVYASGRKICGILTEVPPGCSDRLVVGIGLNVGNTLSGAPAELRSTATSLLDLLGPDHPPREELLWKLISRWEFWLKRLACDEIDFPALWQTKCYLMGEQVAVTIGPETHVGLCTGLDDDGALLLDTDRGPQRILAGTVRRLSP